jgi:hypothetical protein
MISNVAQVTDDPVGVGALARLEHPDGTDDQLAEAIGAELTRQRYRDQALAELTTRCRAPALRTTTQFLLGT